MILPALEFCFASPVYSNYPHNERKQATFTLATLTSENSDERVQITTDYFTTIMVEKYMNGFDG